VTNPSRANASDIFRPFMSEAWSRVQRRAVDARLERKGVNERRMHFDEQVTAVIARSTARILELGL